MFCFVRLCLFQYSYCFLVGWCTNKSYVTATSDLWLFIHASNLLPSHPHSTPLHIFIYIHSRRKSVVSANVHMIEGDIILQGQGTPLQKLIPVMAQPPHSESDLQLVDWLDRVKYLSKGIKLDFSTIDALEISLQRLQELNIQVRFRELE